MTSSGSSSSSRGAPGLLAALSLAAGLLGWPAGGGAQPAAPEPAAAPALTAPAAPAEPAPGPALIRFEAPHPDLEGAGPVAPGLGTAPGPALDHPRPRRLALFPIQNLSGGTAPMKELTAALRQQLEQRGVALVPEEQLQRTMAAHRVRYTGGLDRATARALRQEVGAEGVVIASLEAWLAPRPCRFAMTIRLVSTDDEPVILWIDTFARTGVDAPGLLGLGVLPTVEQLRDRALEQVASSLLDGARPRPVRPCPDRSARPPARAFRAPLLSDPERRTIAVLPFVNGAGRRDAGEVLALRFLAPLVAAGTIRVVEPGVVRAEMLTYRLGATGGISLDDARVLLRVLDADLVLAGTVRTFEEAAGQSGAPSVDFSAWVLDRETARLAWSSTSSGQGDDGVLFFGVGRVSTASGLACAMAKGAVAQLLRGRPPAATFPHTAGIAAPVGERAPAAPP